MWLRQPHAGYPNILSKIVYTRHMQIHHAEIAEYLSRRLKKGRKWFRDKKITLVSLELSHLFSPLNCYSSREKNSITMFDRGSVVVHIPSTARLNIVKKHFPRDRTQ